MDFKLIITGLLSKAYKLDDGEIATLLESGENITEDTVVNLLLSKDTERVANIKKLVDTTGKFQEGYAKAKKEERTNFEKELTDHFGLTSDKTGLELIETIIAEKGAKGGKGTITDDDVKKHPVYQNLETKLKTDLKQANTDWQTKYDTLQSEQKKGETFTVVKSKALTILDGLKPVLPGNSDVAGNLKTTFLQAFKEYDYDLQGDRVVVMKDGKVVEDAHGNSQSFDELAKSMASKFFEFQQNNGGNNPGGDDDDKTKGGNGGYPTGITKPKTIQELNAIVNDTNVKLEDRQKVMEVWTKENSAS